MLEKNEVNLRKYYYLTDQLDSMLNSERTFIRIKEKQIDLSNAELSEQERYYFPILTLVKKALGSGKSQICIEGIYCSKMSKQSTKTG